MLSKLQQSCRLLNHLMRRPGDEFELFSKWVMAEHFTHLTANYCLKIYTVKNSKKTTRQTTSAIWSIFAELNSQGNQGEYALLGRVRRWKRQWPVHYIPSIILVFPFFVSLFPCTISFFNAYSQAYLLPGNFWHHPSLLFGLVLSANHQCQTATFIVIFRTNPNYRISIKNANYIYIFADFFTQTMILIKLFKLDLSSINIWIE